jgi:hypothetical protein
MLSTKTRTTIAALAALGALTLPASALANPLSPTEWRYNRAALCTSTSECSPAQPFAGQLYDLNESHQPYSNKGNSLVYGFTGTGCATSQPGSELQWDWAGHLQWEFRRQAPHPMTSAITGTERVALYNHFHGAYLVLEGPRFTSANQPRTVGLRFSATPSYEWQVADGKGDQAELYNTSAQAYLIRDYPLTFYRHCGIDLTWQPATFSLPDGYQPPPDLVRAPRPEATHP